VLFQASTTISWTVSVAMVVNPVMENRKSGWLGSRGATRKVMSCEDQTPHWRRVSRCEVVRLNIRKEVGVNRILLAFSLGFGDDTAVFWLWVISATAAKIRALTLSCLVGLWASVPKGIAISFSPGHCTHSLTRFGSTSSKGAVGCASWIFGISAWVYLSRGSRGMFLDCFRDACCSRWCTVVRMSHRGVGVLGWTRWGPSAPPARVSVVMPGIGVDRGVLSSCWGGCCGLGESSGIARMSMGGEPDHRSPIGGFPSLWVVGEGGGEGVFSFGNLGSGRGGGGVGVGPSGYPWVWARV
jgi:hypothetical protein